MSNTGTIELPHEEVGELAMALHEAATMLSGYTSKDVSAYELSQIEELELILESLKGKIH